MGIFFHRRAERSHCTPVPVESEQNVCVPEDPRTQYMEMRNQCTDATDRQSTSPRQFAPATPAPAPYVPSEGFGGTTPKENGSRPRHSDLPPLTLTDTPQTQDLFQYGGDGSNPNRRIREVPPPPLPATDLQPPRPRDVFQYSGDGTTQSPRVRDVPPPPLPATDLPPVTIRRDLFQYGDGKTQAPPQRELPPPTTIRHEYRVQPEPDQQNGFEHPGPGSRRRRTLREQLGLPERHLPYRRETRDGAIENPMPLPTVPVPNRERIIQERQERHDDRKEHRLDARLERIREKLERLTHISAREKEQAFSPTSDEQRALQLINNERRRYHLPDVVQDPRLQIIASRHTDYQTRHGMTHTENTPGWQTVSQRMKQVGLEGWRENAATGSFTPESLVRMWMNSPGHKAAILGQGNIAAVSIRNGKATFNLTTDPELQRQS